jgi:copper chaperone CopZ
VPEVALTYSISSLLIEYKKGGEGAMEIKKLAIPNINCGHCVMTIKKELGEIKGVAKVEGDPQKKEITVEWNQPATLEKIKSTLKEINFPAAG